MKIALIVGDVAPHTTELLEYLKQNGYHCIKTSNADEIDQLGQQSGMALLVFSDANFAFKFLTENSWPNVARLNAVYLAKRPVIPEETQRKLNSKDLKLFDPASRDKLLAAMDNFKPSNPGSGEEGVPELEFSIHHELQKEKKK